MVELAIVTLATIRTKRDAWTSGRTVAKVVLVNLIFAGLVWYRKRRRFLPKGRSGTLRPVVIFYLYYLVLCEFFITLDQGDGNGYKALSNV